jgi:hypothetical protein
MIVQVSRRDSLHQFPRLRTGNRNGCQFGRAIFDADIVAREMLLEPAHVEFLQVAGSDDHEPVVGNAHDSQVALHAPGWQQERTHANPSHFRHAACEEVVHPPGRVGAGYLVPGE